MDILQEKKIDEKLKEVVSLGIEHKFLGKHTVVMVKGSYYYVNFDYRLMQNKCPKCGHKIDGIKP